MSRKSKQKEAILKAVKNTYSHPTADWVYEQVKQEMPHISLGTIYRDLRLLREEGKISEINLADTTSRFDGNTQNHYHFRCERCGRIFDVDEPVDKEIEMRVARRTGFLISNHRLEFYGLCLGCKPRDG